ncbi:hypothetical protein Q2T40_00460 [Winogradskyella maritima]|nr:hypothetical protein [Winogradskyella maritima]
MVNRILELKEKHKAWGAKKLHTLLYKDFPDEIIPTVLTVHNILKKHGLVPPQKRLRRVKPIHPVFDPKECNEVWSADYKGKFLMGNKIYCHPLTIADSKSRFVFTAKGHYKENLASAKAEFKGFSGNSASPDKSIPTMEAHLVLLPQYKDSPGYPIGSSNWESCPCFLIRHSHNRTDGMNECTAT